MKPEAIHQKSKLNAARGGDGIPHVKSIDVLLEDYGLPAPDEWGGPESSREFFDYGPPAVLADSAGEQDRTRHERDLEAQLREFVSDP